MEEYFVQEAWEHCQSSLKENLFYQMDQNYDQMTFLTAAEHHSGFHRLTPQIF